MYTAGQRHYTFNVHQLLHMADAVRNLGPLLAHSVFPFEDTNGWLGDLFHGTRSPHKQVSACIHVYLAAYFYQHNCSAECSLLWAKD